MKIQKQKRNTEKSEKGSAGFVFQENRRTAEKHREQTQNSIPLRNLFPVSQKTVKIKQQKRKRKNQKRRGEIDVSRNSPIPWIPEEEYHLPDTEKG